MREKWSRPQAATVIFVLSIALAGGAAIAQEKEGRGAQRQQPSQQEMRQPRDEAIKDRVEMRLARSASLAGTDIQVAVEDRTVSLSGTVGSEQEKARARRIARRVRGVREVKDELSVDKAAVDKRRHVEIDDAELAKQVAKKLTDVTFPWADTEKKWSFGWEVEGYTWEFDVDVDGGAVTLEGEVDSHRDITKTIEAVREVPGVRSVHSKLRSDLYGAPDYRYPYSSYPPYGYRR